MRIFLAGATGALGQRLVPMLIAGGHQVTGMTRNPAHGERLRQIGAEPAIADALDAPRVMSAVLQARPDVVVHQLTSLAGLRSFKHFDRQLELTNRLRTEGTEHLLGAAAAAGAAHFVAQSYTGWPNARSGGRVKSEDDPLDSDPPADMRQTLAAIEKLEQMVLRATSVQGLILRYGGFYGPGTSLSRGSENIEAVRHRKFPIVGSGAGVWSFLHIDDAAYATRLAIEQRAVGKYNVVDDEPAEVSVWLPALAAALGAKAPRHVPAWLGRQILGEAGVSMMIEIRGSSNAKAKRALGWNPLWPSWRLGFVRGLDPGPVPTVT
jgi:nucleoside-diphosphate-sugar epimerase